MIKKLIITMVLMGFISFAYADDIPYWIEDTGSGFNLWIKVSNIPAGGSVQLNISKGGGSPNGDAVFEFFDDFEGDSLDTSKWEKINDGITVENSKITITNDTIGHYLDNIQDKIITAKIINYQSGEWGGYGIYQNFDMNEDVAFEKGFCFRFDSTNTLSVKDWNDGTRDSYWVNEPLPDTLKFKIDNNEVQYYYNNDLLWTKPLPLSEGYLKMVANNGNTLQVDYIFIRKYADQEPTITINKINDSAWGVNITSNIDLEGYQICLNTTSNINDTDNKIYLPNLNSQLNISQEVLKGNLFYINPKNFEMDDNYPSILDRLANLTNREYGKGIKLKG